MQSLKRRRAGGRLSMDCARGSGVPACVPVTAHSVYSSRGSSEPRESACARGYEAAMHGSGVPPRKLKKSDGGSLGDR